MKLRGGRRGTTTALKRDERVVPSTSGWLRHQAPPPRIGSRSRAQKIVATRGSLRRRLSRRILGERPAPAIVSRQFQHRACRPLPPRPRSHLPAPKLAAMRGSPRRRPSQRIQGFRQWPRRPPPPPWPSSHLLAPKLDAARGSVHRLAPPPRSSHSHLPPKRAATRGSVCHPLKSPCSRSLLPAPKLGATCGSPHTSCRRKSLPTPLSRPAASASARATGLLG